LVLFQASTWDTLGAAAEAAATLGRRLRAAGGLHRRVGGPDPRRRVAAATRDLPRPLGAEINQDSKECGIKRAWQECSKFSVEKNIFAFFSRWLKKESRLSS
jgi:hypothetical protein